MSVINSIPLIAAGDDGYQISRSVRLRSSASAYFNRTLASSGTTATFSAWVKRGALGTASTIFGTTDASTYDFQITFTASNTIEFYAFRSSSQVFDLITTAVYRDPSAWYHIVAVINTTNATSTNRVQLYVNGVQVTTFGTAAYPSQNAVTPLADSRTFGLGNRGNANNNYFDGYLTEVNFIDGQALTPSSFGETDTITGVWKPKKYAGTYGTNGFYLNFSDNSAATAAAIGKDSSGNGNNWTPNNISVTAGVTYDSMIDVPTMYADGGNGRGNYAVMNPLRTNSAIVTNGNLSVAQNTTAYVSSSTSMGMTTGKWYWEVTIVSASAQVLSLGISNEPNINGLAAGAWSYHLDGSKYVNGSNSAYGSGYNTNGVVVGFAFDADAGTLTCYRNNTSQGTLVSGLSAGTYYAWATLYNSGTVAFNFGQCPFAYTPPTGFKALNTQNLPDSTIKAGNKWFDATTYTGNGSTQSIVNAGGFQPDLVWVKHRGSASNHYLHDSVRGVGQALYPNLTNAENAPGNAVTAFNSNGFAVGSNVEVNGNLGPIVGWQWKESPSAGFDIVTYTGNGTAGRTVAHNLGVAPAMYILKNRGATGNWPVYHKNANANPQNGGLYLNSTDAFITAAGFWNNTSPTSSVFSTGSGADTNANGNTYVAYLFAEVAGFSKFGSYTGNGSADGPFVFCGFRPKFVMIKRTDNVGDWWIHDSARDTYNVERNYLMANTSAAEAATDNIDFLSNGFKLRVATFQPNTSGGNFIFAAFAENPFKNSLAR